MRNNSIVELRSVASVDNSTNDLATNLLTSEIKNRVFRNMRVFSTNAIEKDKPPGRRNIETKDPIVLVSCIIVLFYSVPLNRWFGFFKIFSSDKN